MDKSNRMRFSCKFQHVHIQSGSSISIFSSGCYGEKLQFIERYFGGRILLSS